MMSIALAAMAESPSDELPWPCDKGLSVMTGHSVVVRAPWPVARVSVSDPKVADVRGLTPDRIMVMGKSIGTTDLMIWNDKEEMRRVPVGVSADIEWLQLELARLLPQAKLEVRQSHDLIILNGTLRTTEQIQLLHKFMDAASMKYVDMTRQAGVQQVQIQVRVAEVSRTALRILGINGSYTNPHAAIGQTVGPSSGGPLNPISIGVPSGTPATGTLPLVFNPVTSTSAGVTLFGGFPDISLQVFMQALSENQYMRILAEPTLVAMSGEDASFLAGGEFPIPVPQNNAGSGTTITVEYKEYGVRLKFHPTVLGENVIRMSIAPEVSELSNAGAVVIQGFSIPSIVTRKAQTTLELKSGQTFAMAGLINHTANGMNSRIPGLGDVPVLGAMFRSVRYENDETELVVLVKASLVDPFSAGQTPPLPGDEHAKPND